MLATDFPLFDQANARHVDENTLGQLSYHRHRRGYVSQLKMDPALAAANIKLFMEKKQDKKTLLACEEEKIAPQSSR